MMLYAVPDGTELLPGDAIFYPYAIPDGMDIRRRAILIPLSTLSGIKCRNRLHNPFQNPEVAEGYNDSNLPGNDRVCFPPPAIA